jgi:hypothetical protein
MKKHITILSFLFLIVSLAIFYGSAQFMYHQTKGDIEKFTLDKVISNIQKQKSGIELALAESSHDLTNEMGALAKDDDVALAFILRDPAKIVASSDPSETLNLAQHSILYENAFMRRQDMTQAIPQTDGPAAESETDTTANSNESTSIVQKNQSSVLYSTSLKSGDILFVEVSLKNADALSLKWRNWYYFPIFALLSVIFTVIIYILGSIIIGIAFKRIKKSYDKTSAMSNDTTEKLRKEMADLNAKLKEAEAKIAAYAEKDAEDPNTDPDPDNNPDTTPTPPADNEKKDESEGPKFTSPFDTFETSQEPPKTNGATDDNLKFAPPKSDIEIPNHFNGTESDPSRFAPQTDIPAQSYYGANGSDFTKFAPQPFNQDSDNQSYNSSVSQPDYSSFQNYNGTQDNASDTPVGDPKYYEMTTLFLKENEKKTRIINSLEDKKQSLKTLLDICLNNYVKIKDSDVYIVLDNENKVVFSFDKTGKVLRPNFDPDAHIATIFLIDRMIEFISAAQDTPNTKVEENAGDINLVFTCISAKGRMVGTIISNA